MGCNTSKEKDEPIPPGPKPKTPGGIGVVTMAKTKFQPGKEVVAEIPHSVGPPLSEFRGLTGTVQGDQMTPDGRVHDVVFDMQRQARIGSAVSVKSREDRTVRLRGKIIYGPDEDQEYIVRFDDTGESSDCLKKEDFDFEDAGDDTRIAKIPAEYLRSVGALAQSTNVTFLTVDQLFKETKVHMVPVFQRRYCWTEQQAKQLWRSVVTMKDADADTNNHSIGRLMLLERSEGTRLVLDGQQRLTTLTLLISSLRDRAAALGESKAAEELDRFCSGRLVPTLDDRPDFELCLSQPRPEGDHALPVVKRVFADLAAQLDVRGVEDMSKAVRRRLSVIAFVLDDERSVQRVYENLAKRVVSLEEARRMGVDLSTCTECFLEEKQTCSTHWGPDGQRLCRAHAEAVGLDACETMTPGIEMSPVDLIRNFVMEHFAEESQMRRAHAECWSPLETKAGGTAEGLERVLKEFLAAQGFTTKHRWELYNAFVVWWRGWRGGDGSLPGSATASDLASARLQEILTSQNLPIPSAL